MAEKNQPISDEVLSIIKAVTQLQTHMSILTEALKKMEEAAEGTVQKKGYKERIAIAEYNIDEHKKAWIKNEQTIREMEEGLNRTFAQVVAEFKASVNGRLDNISASLEKEKTWLSKIKPYMDVLVWIVGIAAGYLVIQFISGNIQIVRLP